MKLAYDFHIHTALSPCADEDMTPNNIINMAILKGLDVIAITDHNSMENCQPCMKVAENSNIVVIPGMELQTKEEVHLLCLFRNLDSAIQFQEIVYSYLSLKHNKPEIFGRQLIFNAEDEIIKENPRMLISSVNMSFKQAYLEIARLKGALVPAHIDRSSYSIISNLGFIPKDLPIRTLEVSKNCDKSLFLSKHPSIKSYKLIKNSDAHYLWDIAEGENHMEALEKTIDSIIDEFI